MKMSSAALLWRRHLSSFGPRWTVGRTAEGIFSWDSVITLVPSQGGLPINPLVPLGIISPAGLLWLLRDAW